MQTSFENLPQTVDEIYKLLATVADNLQLLADNSAASQNSANQWLSVEQLTEFLPGNPSRSTIYKWCCEHTIPYHKQGKRLCFLRSEIDTWLLSHARKSASQIAEEAQNNLRNKK